MSELKIISLETVMRKAISWLLKPYIAFGKITIIEGDPGCGKTMFACYLMALLSTGKIYTPDGVQDGLEPIKIVYQNAEDGLADTIVDRLETAGANMSNIKVIDETEKLLTMLDVRIEQAILETGAKLLVLDPFQAYIGENVDLHRANETRVVLKQLGAVAERTDCAIILVRHLAKATGSKALYKGLGSIDIVGAARSVLLLGSSPNDDSVRGIVQTKNNLAQKGEPMAFRLDENGFEWLGAYDITEDDLSVGFSSGDKKKQASDLIKKFLNGKDKSVAANDIISKGIAVGISKRTMEDAKRELGIKSVRVGQAWHWKF
ncbi:MAG: AAA family ATPase [Oscillospiraceae bacterium]|nr:AAA family ATPase [Oscillospiraceae bacterium]